MDEAVRFAPLVLLIAALYLAASIEARCGLMGTKAAPLEEFAGGCYRLLAVAFWPVALIWTANFPARQGVVLGLMLAWLAQQVSRASNKSIQWFTPYSVSVTPLWERILVDFKLVSSPEEWRSISGSTQVPPAFNALQSSIRFTVVRQGGGAATVLPKRDRELHVGWQEVRCFDNAMNEEHPPLIFWERHQTFGTRFGFSEEMTPIRLEHTGPAYLPRTATLFMGLHCTYSENPHGPKYRPGVLGSFDFGLYVPHAWWERVKDVSPAPLRIDSKPDSSSVSLIIATLPLSEFYSYRIQPERSLETDLYLEKRSKEQLVNLGWTRSPAAELCHKYFIVGHHAI